MVQVAIYKHSVSISYMVARRRIWVRKGNGINYGEATPHQKYFLTLSNPNPPPCYRISDL